MHPRRRCSNICFCQPATIFSLGAAAILVRPAPPDAWRMPIHLRPKPNRQISAWQCCTYSQPTHYGSKNWHCQRGTDNGRTVRNHASCFRGMLYCYRRIFYQWHQIDWHVIPLYFIRILRTIEPLSFKVCAKVANHVPRWHHRTVLLRYTLGPHPSVGKIPAIFSCFRVCFSWDITQHRWQDGFEFSWNNYRSIRRWLAGWICHPRLTFRDRYTRRNHCPRTVRGGGWDSQRSNSYAIENSNSVWRFTFFLIRLQTSAIVATRTNTHHTTITRGK